MDKRDRGMAIIHHVDGAGAAKKLIENTEMQIGVSGWTPGGL
jgi:hypothetical protein